MSVTQTVYHAGIPVDLAAPSRQQIGASQFFYGDNRSHVFTALVGDTDHPETGLRSGAVTGAVLRKDGTTVVLAGEKGAATVPTVYPNGKAANATACSVTLPQECFAVPGPILITIKLVDGETVTSVLNIGGTVIRVETDSAVDPGEIIPDVSTLAASARAALAAAEEANTAASGADTAAAAAEEATGRVDDAIRDAESAAESAYAAVEDATAAATEAYDKAQVANTAAQAANTAATAAGTAATAADTAADNADDAARGANAANVIATGAAQLANTAASDANTAASDANAAAQAANTAATAAGTAATAADTAAQAANAAAAAASAAMAGAVRFDAAQTLTEAQAAQARGNIGAASAGDIPTGAVRYDEAQALTDAQAAQARGNIGAAGAADIISLMACTGTVNYGYDNPWSLEVTELNPYTAVRNSVFLTLNSTEAMPGTRYIRLTNEASRPGSKADVEGWTNGIAYEPGRIYLAQYRLVSGTATVSTAGTPPALGVYEEGSSTNLGYASASSVSPMFYWRVFKAGATPINLAFVCGTGASFTNAKFEITVQDITDGNIEVTGATPSITAIPGAAYNCIGTGTAAEPVAVTELDFTPSASGICSVRFVSGTTPTLLTLPDTVETPDWFDRDHLEASRTYEISIADGKFGVVTSWA